MDFLIRLFIRLSHIILVSNCCSYGIQEEIIPQREEAPRTDEEKFEEISF